MGIFPIGASRLLFGRDFFISYPRREAARYAATLASRLSKQFSCYLDQLATPRGEKLPTPISRELARATVFVLVGSPGAIESIYVRSIASGSRWTRFSARSRRRRFSITCTTRSRSRSRIDASAWRAPSPR
jgi:hypothetical protein